ncbi:single-stranded DNA-binding protein [Ligilactobacillus equi]
MNNVTLVGRLTKDPEIRTTQSGKSTCTFTLAVDRVNKNQQDADFIQCVVWEKQAENLARYQHKGSRIGVEGRIQTRTYDNNEGQRVYVTEVIAQRIEFLTSKAEDQGNYQPSQVPQRGYGQVPKQGFNQTPQNQGNYGAPQQVAQPRNWSPQQGAGEQVDIQDDDLPF